jgi:hypothetical protein
LLSLSLSLLFSSSATGSSGLKSSSEELRMRRKAKVKVGKKIPKHLGFESIKSKLKTPSSAWAFNGRGTMILVKEFEQVLLPQPLLPFFVLPTSSLFSSSYLSSHLSFLHPFKEANPGWTTDNIEKEYQNLFHVTNFIWLKKGLTENQQPWKGVTEVSSNSEPPITSHTTFCPSARIDQVRR